MHRFQHTLSTGLLAATLLALVAAGCGGANGADEAPRTAGDAPRRVVRVETLVLQPTSFEDVIQMTGTVASLNDATLSAQAAGTVEFLAPLGRRVARGAVVARIDQGLVRAALQQTEAQLTAAQAQLEWDEYNFARQEALFRDSVISALEFQTAQTRLNQARAERDRARAARAQAQEQLQNATVRAPFSGVVEAHFVEQGEQMTPGQQVLRVVNIDRLKVTVGVPERYAGDIRVGTPVRLDFQAYRGASRRGAVTFAGSAIDPQSRTFPVEIEVDNADGQLKPEMIVQVYVTRETLEGVLVVPRAAVLRDENGTGAFVVNRDGAEPTAERRDVVVGPAYGGRVSIERGLAPGEEVLVLGQNNVTEGDAVEVVEQYRRLDEAGVPLKDA